MVFYTSSTNKHSSCFQEKYYKITREYPIHGYFLGLHDAYKSLDKGRQGIYIAPKYMDSFCSYPLAFLISQNICDVRYV